MSLDIASRSRARYLASTISAFALLPLVACGGGGASSTPPPIAKPSPSPTPTPPPPPPPLPTSTNYDTVEYRSSVGPSFHDAIAAYDQGATGAGVLVGVIDSGIDRNSPEFTGRISSLSRDFGGNGTIQDEGGHGTAVSATALGAKNDYETHGIAFGATLLTLRADEKGSCASEDPADEDSGCSFKSSAIAGALNHATDSGARVVNISLGGGGIGTSLRNAISRAAASGVVIVVSAGNDGESDEPGIDSASPDPFAQGIASAGSGLVIIAGSVGTAANDSRISSFSNRAGSFRDVYLTALGYRVRAPDQSGDIFLWSGTSFSAPQIAGAAALLVQAFPNLSGAQIVDILLKSGRDAGVAGTDNVYGRGILDIGAAFKPIGTTTLAGSQDPVATEAESGSASGPMGDALASGSTRAIVLDDYARAFAFDLAGTVRTAGPEFKLIPALGVAQRQLSVSSPALSVSLSIAPGRSEMIYGAQTLMPDDAEAARVLAGSVLARLSPDTSIAFGIRRGSNGLSAALEGRDQPAFLVGEAARGQPGFGLSPLSALAVRRDLGKGLGMTLRGETGSARVREVRPFAQLRTPRPAYRYSVVGAAFDRHVGAVRFDLAGEMMREDATVLGAKFGPLYGGGGATSLFVDAGVRAALGAGWSIGGQWRQGWTWANAGGLIVSGSRLMSNAWSIDAAKVGVFANDDSLSLRIAQPLRVSSGGLRLNLPVGYDYATLQTEYGVRTLNLAPTGREIDVEGVYGGAFAGGRLTLNAYYRKDPGNIASLRDDLGTAIRFTLGF